MILQCGKNVLLAIIRKRVAADDGRNAVAHVSIYLQQSKTASASRPSISSRFNLVKRVCSTAKSARASSRLFSRSPADPLMFALGGAGIGGLLFTQRKAQESCIPGKGKAQSSRTLRKRLSGGSGSGQ